MRTLLPVLGAHRIGRAPAGLLLLHVGRRWATTAAFSFDFAGLFDDHFGKLVAKPAYTAFRSGALALERCRRLGAVAGRCAAPMG